MTSSHIADPADGRDVNADYLAYQSLLGTDNPTAGAQDPFKNESAIDDTTNDDAAVGRTNSESLSPPSSPTDRRMSREWGTFHALRLSRFCKDP